MNDTAVTPAHCESAPANPPATLLVWDPLVRIFHWSLVSFFALAWFSADISSTLHIWSGYCIAALLLFRLVWGWIGCRHARFADFVPTPASLWHYLRTLRQPNSPRYLGHNPAGGAMVIALMLSLAATLLSGLALLANSVVAGFPDWQLQDLHELATSLTLGLIGLHLSGVLFSSLHQRENLIRAMFTGQKEIRSGDSHASRTSSATQE